MNIDDHLQRSLSISETKLYLEKLRLQQTGTCAALQAIPRERPLSAPPHAGPRCLLLCIALPARQGGRSTP